jgi:transposase-like protein
VIEVADRYGVSRQAVHGWLRRYRTGGLEALADRSHRPHSCPHQMTPEMAGSTGPGKPQPELDTQLPACWR